MPYINYYSDKYPRTTSFGIIPFTIINNKPYFVLIQRKETISFVIIIKNKFTKLKIDIEREIEKMTKEEKKNILLFLEWNKKKNIQSDFIEVLEQYKPSLENDKCGELEWFFPKGRRNNTIEPTHIAAIREFYEETQFDKCIKQIYLENKVECYKYGSDKKRYSYIFYPALIDISKTKLSLDNRIVNINSHEVSNIGLYDEEEMKEITNKVIPYLGDKILDYMPSIL